MARAIFVAVWTCAVAALGSVGCGADGADNGAHTDAIDRGQRYAESREFRRDILESSLENHQNLYSRVRLNHYALEDEGWDTLPVRRPSVQPITAADFGTFDDMGRREATEPAASTNWESTWEHEALLELGERAFETYPMRADARLAPVVQSLENVERTGFWFDDRERVGGLVAEQIGDDREIVAWTCSSCHASVRKTGQPVVQGRSNADIDTGELYRLGGYSDAVVGDWLPGQIDSSQDGIDNPTAIPDLRPVRYQSHLHAAASIANSLMALTVRVETLLIVSQSQTSRPPRRLAFAIAYYLWNLPVPRADADSERGWEIFEQHCGRCHYPDGSVAPPVDYEVIGTDPKAAQSPARTTGRYRIPSLAGVADRPYLLHDGSVRSVEQFFDPDRHKTAPGHLFGLDLSDNDRDALIDVLGAVPVDH